MLRPLIAARRSRPCCASYWRTCHVWQGLLGRRRGRRGAAVQDSGAGRADGHHVLAVRRMRLEPSLALGRLRATPLRTRPPAELTC
eukprot:scaffold53905_cov63-Phaeocystis_antarctica.AAC.2